MKCYAGQELLDKPAAIPFAGGCSDPKASAWSGRHVSVNVAGFRCSLRGPWRHIIRGSPIAAIQDLRLSFRRRTNLLFALGHSSLAR